MAAEAIRVVQAGTPIQAGTLAQAGTRVRVLILVQVSTLEVLIIAMIIRKERQ